jgi:redox-sensitive bicupin YhaK (pirin superfamily)
VLHSEFNHAADATTHFLQIWVLPDRQGATPGYAQQAFDPAEQRGRLRLAVAPTAEAGAGGALSWNADARLHLGRFGTAGETARLAIAPGRKAYVHLAQGRLVVNGQALQAGDALAMSEEREVEIQGAGGPQGEDEALVLVFDLAP